MDTQSNVIEAAVRFLRTNPELVAFAQAEAAASGLSVERLLGDTVARVRGQVAASALEAIAEQQMILGSSRRLQRRSG